MKKMEMDWPIVKKPYFSKQAVKYNWVGKRKIGRLTVTMRCRGRHIGKYDDINWNKNLCAEYRKLVEITIYYAQGQEN